MPLTEREKAKVREARYKAKYPERIIEAKRRWRERNREKLRADFLAYYQKNKEKLRAIRCATQVARQARQKKAMPHWVDRDAIAAKYREAARLSQETGIKFSVDHIVPLQGKNVCGLHVPWNLQVIPLAENVRKFNKFESL